MLGFEDLGCRVSSFGFEAGSVGFLRLGFLFLGVYTMYYIYVCIYIYIHIGWGFLGP